MVFVANDASNNNTGHSFLFYNNTMVNIPGTWSGVSFRRARANEVRNNIWYNCVRTNN